jgi:mannobiose 2-epimerase
MPLRSPWSFVAVITLAVLQSACSESTSDPSAEIDPATPTPSAGGAGNEGGANGAGGQGENGNGAGNAAGAGDGGGEAGPSVPIKEKLADLKARLDVLADKTMAWWVTHGPDKEYGGFHGRLDRQGNPTDPSDKGIIQQARHLWTFSVWNETRKPTVEISAAANDTYQFITKNFRDPEDGEFFTTVARDGTAKNTQKIQYGQAFSIYALSTYSRSFGPEAAREQALRCFKSLDARAHDAEHGGYLQINDVSWITTEKDYNTLLHILEALTVLYDVSEDATVKARLNELLTAFTDKMFQPQGYIHLGYKRDWTPVGPKTVSYGHDLESAYLLMEAARVLDRDEEPHVLTVVKTIATNSASWGFDRATGTFHESGPIGGQPKAPATERIWWVQFEALNGLFELYYLTKNPEYLVQFDRVLSWLEKTWDKDGGEWFWGTKLDGSAGPRGSHKGEEWKASYHNLRALLVNSDRIAESLR